MGRASAAVRQAGAVAWQAREALESLNLDRMREIEEGARVPPGLDLTYITDRIIGALPRCPVAVCRPLH